MPTPRDFASDLLAALEGDLDETKLHPFAQLATALERDGDVPQAWLQAHAPNRNLSDLWNACNDAGLLLQLAAHTRAPADLVRLACDCARTAMELVPTSE